MDDPRITHAPGRVARLIARCLSGDTRSAASEIEADGLWEYVATAADRLEVVPVLARQLERSMTLVPTRVSAQLDAGCEHVEAAGVYQRERMEPVLTGLQRANIDFLLLKGAALDTLLFDHPGMRPMADVDLLIRPEDVGRADALLRELGCTPGADLLNDDFYPRFYYEREYFTPDCPPVKIDLHVRPFRPLRYARTVPDDALWEDPLSVRIGSCDVAIPNPTHMLIHLAVHAACHGLIGLKWLYDIKRWLDCFGDRIDLKDLAGKCRRWQLTLPVRRTLEAVADLFGPPSTVHRQALHAVCRPTSWRDRLLLAQCPHDYDRPVRALAVNMLCTPGLRFRLAYLRSVLLPGRRHLAQLYPHRHPGWPIVAHGVRIARGLTRPFAADDPQPA